MAAFDYTKLSNCRMVECEWIFEYRIYTFTIRKNSRWNKVCLRERARARSQVIFGILCDKIVSPFALYLFHCWWTNNHLPYTVWKKIIIIICENRDHYNDTHNSTFICIFFGLDNIPFVVIVVVNGSTIFIGHKTRNIVLNVVICFAKLVLLAHTHTHTPT